MFNDAVLCSNKEIFIYRKKDSHYISKTLSDIAEGMGCSKL